MRIIIRLNLPPQTLLAMVLGVVGLVSFAQF